MSPAGRSRAAALAVCVEAGARRTFASALEWPGWARAGRDEAEAIERLGAYAARYRAVLEAAGLDTPAPDAAVRVAQRVAGTSGTDFGIPSVPAAAERRPLDPAGASRLCALVAAAWAAFDAAVSVAPATLRKGPRGGGRDTEAIVTHPHDSEGAYAAKLGLRLGARRPFGHGRDEILEALRLGAMQGEPAGPKAWPARYCARRIAWHALDHAWEIEDRSLPA